MFNNNNFDNEIMMESRKALEKLQSKQIHEKTLENKMFEHWEKYDKGRSFFEEYTPELFESKIKVDLLYMDQLLQKLDNHQISEVENLISSLYQNVREIYEIMNIKPEIYGRDVSEDVINESSEIVHSKLSKNIHSFLSTRYYDLPLEKREDVYFERVKDHSADLIIENHTPQDAVEYSIKVCLMEDFMQTVCFPFSAKSRLEYLLEDEAFGDVFDQNSLQENYNLFNTKLKGISRIIAACV